jgi:hypothetical protein
MHLFGRKHDHDYYFELLCAEEWDAQSMCRCSTAHHGDFRAAPRVYLGRWPMKSHENHFESMKNGTGPSGEIEFAVEELRLSACLIRSVRG